MGIARNTQQLMMLKGEKIYHSMKTEAKSVIRDRKVKLRTHPKCFTGRYVQCISTYTTHTQHTHNCVYVHNM